jgi:phosphoribosylaminoimidazole-succinocarboxamide synthase
VIAPALDATLPGLTLFRRGKVRDTYLFDNALLMVASDRISAFDVVLPTPIPGKGAILTQLSRYWFGLTGSIVPNHLISATFADFPPELASYESELAGRVMLVRRADRIDVECVVRGYLAGSAWSEYLKTGTMAGERLPEGLKQAEHLPRPVFTPAIKNDAGHDQNISIAALRDLVGSELSERLASTSLALYQFAAAHAARRGIILADTKFEFGWIDGEFHLIDEILTSDSSRFWDAVAYEPGHDQPSFDKQFVRDWLTQSGWNKEPPAPSLPPEVVAGTLARYHEAFERLTGSPLRLPDRPGQVL